MHDALAGRTALVTGSTRGVGNAIAHRLAADGARVVVHGRDRQDVDRVVSTIEGSIGVVGDIANPAEVSMICERAVEAAGAIDIVVNNAGTSHHGSFLEATDGEWNRLLAVNLLGPRNVIRAVLPGMVDAGWGRIVNVTSEAGIRGAAGYSAYAATKGALVALSLTLALELEGTGVCVNSFAPVALTDMVRSQVDPDRLDQLVARGIPSVEDCAETMFPLVGRDAPTGQIVVMHLGGSAVEVTTALASS